MSKKLRVGILGGTGFVGQRFITLLENHPYFEITLIAASPRSAGQRYEDSVKDRWKIKESLPNSVKDLIVKDVNDIDQIKLLVDFVFCAVDMKKDEIKALEEAYAKAEIPVISNNSAHRMTKDVPMVIPEINVDHFEIIKKQKERLGTKRGFIAVKPNCSIQSYVPMLNALRQFNITEVVVCTYQAISGAGKTFSDWPEMNDNVIPFIGGEEEKSEQEPLKIWGTLTEDSINLASTPKITTQCIRVPASDGHLAAVFVNFENKPTRDQILKAWEDYSGKPQELQLPHAPKQFITYFEEENRPQTRLDRDIEGGMGTSVGRLREDSVYDYKFIGLSHNTIRGAAGGAVLTAELLYKLGLLD